MHLSKFLAENVGRRLEDQEGLRRALDAGVNPSEETRKLAFGTFFGDTLENMIDSDFDIDKRIKDDPNFGALFRTVMSAALRRHYRNPPGSGEL